MTQSTGQTSLKGIPYTHPHHSKPVFLSEQLEIEAQDSYVSTQELDLTPQPKQKFKGKLSRQQNQDKSSCSASTAKAEPLQFKLGGSKISGHLLNDIHHADYPSSHYEIRTFMPTSNGQIAAIDFKRLLETNSMPALPSQYYVVTSNQVTKAVATTSSQRDEQLKNGLQIGDRVVPKDATLNPTDVTMYLGSTGDVSTRYAQQLSQIGKIEGFHIVAGIDGNLSSFQQHLQGYDNISLMNIPDGEAWVEDYSEPSLSHGQITPAIFDDNSSLISEAIREGREQRYRGTGVDGKFAFHGAVNQGKFQQVALARGTLTSGPMRQALSYLEGGNIYTGSRQNGEGYVLVGKDSFHVTTRLLEKQTGKSWPEDKVKEVIAADLGLDPKNVVPVEQPGAFHLDMRMTAIAPGEILLNDSKAACEQQLAWARQAVNDAQKQGQLSKQQARQQLKNIDSQAVAMRKQAEKMAPYEEMTAKDLQAAGFTVHRLGGSFVDPEQPGRDTANYFNARHFTNEQGQRISVLMGGKAQEEAYMAQKIFDLAHGTISRIHFLDPSVTQRTLDLWGGLKCRTKPEGDLISQAQLQNPPQACLQTA